MPSLLTKEVDGAGWKTKELNRLRVQERQYFFIFHCHQPGPQWVLRPELAQVTGWSLPWWGEGWWQRGRNTEIPGDFRG